MFSSILLISLVITCSVTNPITRTDNIDKEIGLDLFEEKFENNPYSNPESYILVPAFIVKSSQTDGKTHILVKRQSSGDNSRANRNEIGFYRGQAYVGYLNNYDFFPTVAV
ncbi:unnamed protein product [Ceutorhynchus assimilis]|uniref:Uncharacterized protein n=1 Tax=Ceutorhynchus assimilis TaxID=467358 RepID=A0A9N9MH81_9CUCU|nr:unnamed protein product [Ceutorhynchus assimilis]